MPSLQNPPPSIGMNLSPYRPPRWAVPLAFALVYLSWGTTYLAIKAGVEEFPPGLFGGVRVILAGSILLGYLTCRGGSARLSRSELGMAAGVGVLLFLGGNYLLTVAEQYIDSSVAAVLIATTPLWTGLIETAWPGGERLTGRGWLGVLAGSCGVLLLFAPQLNESDKLSNMGPPLVLASAFSWAVGSCVLRRQRQRGPHLATIAYQMIFGGASQILVGLVSGETSRLSLERFTFPAIYAFFHLLVVGSLIGFVAYTWLLGHVSATRAGTYAYVNPLIAILVGWGIAKEPITGWIVGGMACILAGVALVRGD